MNEKQLLRNPDIEPSDDVIAGALGASNNTYIMFVNELEKHHIRLEWRYYTDGKAWLGKGLYQWTGIRGCHKETTVFWLSAWDGFFKVTIYFPEKFRTDVLALPLDNTVKQMAADSKQMGKLKYFPVTFELRSDKFLDAVFMLADFRKSLK